MLDSGAPRLVVDLVATIARTIDASIGAGSIHNAREALIEGRRGRMLRMILEDLETEEPLAYASDAIGS